MKKLLLLSLSIILILAFGCSKKKEQVLNNIKDKMVADLTSLSSLAQMQYHKEKTFTNWEIPLSLKKTFYADYEITEKNIDSLKLKATCYVTIGGDYFNILCESKVTSSRMYINFLENN